MAELVKKCMCVPCNNVVTARVQGFLNPNQKDMLGYFCKYCVRAECNHTCKGQKAA